MSLSAFVVSTVMLMNTWNEAIRLASILLKRIRDYDKRAVRQYFTRDCYRSETANWHFDTKVKRCLRTWYFRALVTVASLIMPFVKAFGSKHLANIIEELDLSVIDTKHDLLRSLLKAIYDTLLSDKGNNMNILTNSASAARLLASGLADVQAQIARIENLMRECRDGVVRYYDEALDCSDLWSYDAYLHQVAQSLEELSKKFNTSIDVDNRKQWWWYE